MKPIYYIKLSEAHLAIADVMPSVSPHPSSPCAGLTHYLITRINVPRPYRGQGHARAMLREICEDADKDGIALTLHIVPSGGLDADQLMAWYERYGFVFEDRSLCMIRPPRLLERKEN